MINPDALLLCGILTLSLVGFVTGIIRYDLVAIITLLFTTILGLIPVQDAFLGFGHPAVITVAAVLIISKAFFHSGLVESISKYVLKFGAQPTTQVLGLTVIVTVFSAFMNNVGALALMLPVALKVAQTQNLSPSRLLMPLSFGSLLGGLTTMIGTPPNIIVASYWKNISNQSFSLFSFAPVGIAISISGVLFIGLIGWRFLPNRKGQSSTLGRFEIESYLSELRVTKDSNILGMTLRGFHKQYPHEANIIAIFRGDNEFSSYNFLGTIKESDILLVEGETENIEILADKAQLSIGYLSSKSENSETDKVKLKSKDLSMSEAVVMANSRLVGKTIADIRLFHRYQLHLIAVARQGRRLRQRLRNIVFQNGDILLLQGNSIDLDEQLAALKCLPLAQRELNIGIPKKLYLSIFIFIIAICAMLTGLAPAHIALTIAAITMIITKVIDLETAYDGIDFPILILLASMIPVGQALESTGGAEWLAHQMLFYGANLPPVASLAALLLVTMLLSDIINNAAAAVLMAPIGLKLAQGLEVAPQAFLMAVAIGASCAFLTPIGHQSNVLVFSPGGYQFSDYWKLGLPVQVVVFLVAIPMLLWIWPL